MSEDEDNYSAASGEAAPKQQSVFFNMFPISSDSNDGIDKDTIIDQMQEKFGELLKENQELYSAKNQLNALKDKIVQLQHDKENEKHQFEDTITQYEYKCRDYEDKIASLNQKIQELKEDNDHLSNTVIELKRKLQQISQDSEDSIQEQVSSQTGELRATVVGKDKEIESLKKQLKELKNAYSSSSDSMGNVKIENERLSTNNEHLAQELKNCKETISNLNVKMTQLKDELRKEQSNSKSQELSLRDLKATKTTLTDQINTLKSQLTQKENELARANEEVQKVITFGDGFQNVTAALSHFQKVMNAVPKLKAELVVSQKNYKKAVKLYETTKSKIKEVEDNLKAEKKTNAKYGQTIDANSVKIEQLKKRLNQCLEKLPLIPTLSNANNALSKELYQIRLLLDPNEIKYPLRSVIISIVMFKRWMSLPGSKRVYTNDRRNYYWLDNHNDENPIISSIRSLQTKLNFAEQDNQQLHDVIEEKKSTISKMSKKDEKKEKEYEDAIKKAAELQEESEHLHKQIEEMVQQNDYKQLEGEYVSTKAKKKAHKETIKMNELEIEGLQNQLQESKQKIVQLTLQNKQKDRLMNDLKIELLQAQDGMCTLQQGIASKTIDILALERGLQRESRVKQAAVLEGSTLAIENRRLAIQITKNRRQFEVFDHQDVVNDARR